MNALIFGRALAGFGVRMTGYRCVLDAKFGRGRVCISGALVF